MRKIFFSLSLIPLVITGFLSFSFAQEEPKPNTSPEITSISVHKQNLVTAIEVKGNKAISSNTIVSKMKTHIGDPYQETVVSEDLKRLYLLGFFSDINIDTENYKDGLKVIISVTERPIISKINFVGINHITMKDDKLKGLLKSKEKQYLDYPNLAEDVKTLQNMYEKMGYSQAKIDYKANVNKDVNKAEVVFNVVEGGKVRIKDIIVDGNKNFSSARILKLLKTKSAWFFNAGVLKEDVLKEDMDRIKAFYHKNGFSDISVAYEVKYDPLKKFFLHVFIRINEGKKYIVGNVTLQGNKEISEKLILSSLKNCLPGKVYSEEALKEDVSSIQSLYFGHGYISCQVQDTASVNNESGRVDINYSITENQVSYVDKIKIRGNVKTRDMVIRRELRIRPGDEFDGEKLRRSKERLQNLGYFDDISYDTEETNEPDKKNLIVNVKEAKTGSFSFGGGYSTVDSIVGFAEIEQKNFDWKNWPYFTGAGQDLKLRASIGSITHEFELSFTEPRLFDYPISFGFDAYNREHKKDIDVGYGYNEKITGGDLRLGRELTEYSRGDLVYRLDQITISGVDTSIVSPALLDEQGTNWVSSITPSFTFDSRDNVFDPRKGDFFNSSFQFAGGPLGGDKEFWKFIGRYSHYFPMPYNATIEVKSRIGLSDSYGDSYELPVYERFFAGGGDTIRGYKERALGPADPATDDPMGGNSMLIGNIEYTYPVLSFLKVAVFYDVGNVWAKIRDIGSTRDANGVINSGGFKSGVGLGVRLKTPIGPIVLDYGIPLNKAPGQTTRSSGGRFSFSASHSF